MWLFYEFLWFVVCSSGRLVPNFNLLLLIPAFSSLSLAGYVLCGRKIWNFTPQPDSLGIIAGLLVLGRYAFIRCSSDAVLIWIPWAWGQKVPAAAASSNTVRSCLPTDVNRYQWDTVQIQPATLDCIHSILLTVGSPRTRCGVPSRTKGLSRWELKSTV